MDNQPPYQETPSGTPPPPPGTGYYSERGSQEYAWPEPGYGPPPGYGQPASGYMPPPGYPRPGPGYMPPPGYPLPGPGYMLPPRYAQPFLPGGVYVSPIPDPNKGIAVAGFVLGIVSLCLLCVPVVGTLVAALGIIFSAVGQKSVTSRGLAVAGLVLSIVATVISVLFFLAIMHR